MDTERRRLDEVRGRGVPWRKWGRRPVYPEIPEDPHWRDLVLFYEYSHGDNGAGLGASHQTGWTGVIARAMHLFAKNTGRFSSWAELRAPWRSSQSRRRAVGGTDMNMTAPENRGMRG